MKKVKDTALGLSLACASLAIVSAAAEAIVRTYKALKPAVETGAITPDPRYGWRATPGYTYEGFRIDSAGHRNLVRVFADENGFREFADLGDSGFRIFFIGDSHTFAKEVDQEDTYYRRVGDLLGARIFAYGADGFCKTQ